jgi:hypothetical protein
MDFGQECTIFDIVVRISDRIIYEIRGIYALTTSKKCPDFGQNGKIGVFAAKIAKMGVRISDTTVTVRRLT